MSVSRMCHLLGTARGAEGCRFLADAFLNSDFSCMLAQGKLTGNWSAPHRSEGPTINWPTDPWSKQTTNQLKQCDSSKCWESTIWTATFALNQWVQNLVLHHNGLQRTRTGGTIDRWHQLCGWWSAGHQAPGIAGFSGQAWRFVKVDGSWC